MSVAGRFIAVEGLDGVGKSTLAASVARLLGAELLAFPGMPRSAAHAVLTALGPDPTARCLFHAACSRALGLRAASLAADGRDVVVDRFWLSSLAYARARGVTLDVSSLEVIIPRPSVTVILTLPEAERHERLLARGPTDVDRETMTAGFAERVLAAMRERGPLDGFAADHWLDVGGLDLARAHAVLLAAISTSARTTPTLPPEA